MVVLDVQDKGAGIGAAAADPLLSSGYGLTAMCKRVEQLHGSLLIESSPGEGTTLVIEIPLEGHPARRAVSRLSRHGSGPVGAHAGRAHPARGLRA
jgi:signal transduction histidine kinase